LFEEISQLLNFNLNTREGFRCDDVFKRLHEKHYTSPCSIEIIKLTDSIVLMDVNFRSEY